MHFRGVGGLHDIARQARIGEKIELRLGRLDVAGERTSINTDSQMELEMPTIRNQVDKLQGNLNGIVTRFSPANISLLLLKKIVLF